MSENLKLDMTVDEALAFAEEWTRGMTLHAGSQGWRVVCLLLGEEVRALREENERLTAALTPQPIKEGIYPWAEPLEKTRQKAEFWLDGGRKAEKDPERDMMYCQAMFTWMNFAYHYAEKAHKLESQLAELRQGGEGNCPAGLQMHLAATEDGDACPFCETPQPAIPPGYAVPEALRHAAKVVQLFDDATMRCDHMIDASECEQILLGLAEYHDAMLTAAPSVPVAEKVPSILFDGYSVYSGLSDQAKKRTSADNVSDTLDSVVKLLRAAPADSKEGE